MQKYIQKNYLMIVLILTLVMFAGNSIVVAGETELTWDSPGDNTDGSLLTDLAGYKVYYGIVSGNYTQSIDVKNINTYLVSGLTGNEIYYFSVTSYNILGYESSYSNEVVRAIPAPPSADILLSQTDSPDPVIAGNNVTYTLIVTNNGLNDATGVTLTDILPAGITYLSATPSQGNCAETLSILTCNLGTMTNGSKITVDIVVASVNPAILTNTASVLSDLNDPDNSNNSSLENTTVNFLQHTYTVIKTGTGTGTVTSTAFGLDCGSVCTQTYDEGTIVSLTVIPDIDSEFVGWSGTTDCLDGVVTMNTSKSCTATFNLRPPPTHTLTIMRTGTGTGKVKSVLPGIDCGADCVHVYEEGTRVSLIAIFDNLSEFAGWSGATDCLDGAVTMSTSITCTVSFNLIPIPTHSLTVMKSGTGTGMVTSTPFGIDCGLYCTQVYDEGINVSLTAIPDTGSEFAGWSGATDCLDGVVTMNIVKSCTATFNLIPIPTHTLTIMTAGTGTGTVTSVQPGVDCGADCVHVYEEGTRVSLIAIFDNLSEFAGWSGPTDCLDGVVLMNTSITCTVSFNLIPIPTHTLTVMKSGTGTGTVASSPGGNYCDGCVREYSENTSVILTSSPDFGSTFDRWVGCDTILQNNCTITLTANAAVSAVFNLIPINSISGQVTLLGGELSVSNTDLTLTGYWDSIKSPSADGNYIFNDLPEGAYILTPFLTGYYFFPSAYIYFNLNSRQDIQNFYGLHVTYDSDKDTLPDWWEYENFGYPVLDQKDTDNFDDDTWNNLEEFQNDTDPKNASPDTPTLIFPLDMAFDVPLLPAFEGSKFSDFEVDFHKSTHWQISAIPFNDNIGFSTQDLVFASLDSINKTRILVDKGILVPETTYYVRLNYSDYGGFSRWSTWMQGADGPGVQFTTSSDFNDLDKDGIPDDQQIDALIDMDGDGVDDNSQSNIASLINVVSLSQVAVKASLGDVTYLQTENANNLPNIPPDFNFADGVFNFRIENLVPGQEIEVTFYLSELFSDNDKWFKYTETAGWVDFTGFIVSGIGTKVISIKYKDGSFGDADSLENGVIVDPAGPGFTYDDVLVPIVNLPVGAPPADKGDDSGDDTNDGLPSGAPQVDTGEDGAGGTGCFIGTFSL